MERDRIVGITSRSVMGLRAINLLLGLVVVLMLFATWPAHDLLTARLATKYGAGFPAETLVWEIRGLASLGVVGTAIVEWLLRELAAILATLRAGDPFADVNAGRITGIAWALLAWQLLELLLFALSLAIARTGAETIEWTPSLGGWFAVLVAFVLARVFATGSRMRAELATTV